MFKIRPYHPTDLTSVYRICLQTGDSGQDATHLYRDPDLIGHFYAAPYAVLEPEFAFILTVNEMPCGYVIGTPDSVLFEKRCEEEWFPPLRARYPLPAPDDASVGANIIRSIHRGYHAQPKLAEYPAHLHIDILPVGQSQGWGKRMIHTLLDAMRAQNVSAVHLGVGAQNTRAIGFYEHVGFHRIVEGKWGIDFGMRL